MYNFFKFVFLFLIILFATSCKKGLQIKDNSLFEAQTFFTQEAKFYDIPIPLGSAPVSKYITENSYSYSINSNINYLTSFYEIEMENHGWKKIEQFNSFEILLIYSKPNKKSVSISIRPDSNDKQIIIIFFNN